MNISATTHLGSELLVDEAGAALVAEEAGLVPVLLLVGQILAVDADDLAALVAVVGKHILVALDAVRVVIARSNMWYLLSSIFQIDQHQVHNFR